MSQDFDGIRVSDGTAITLLPPDGWAWFHLDNGPAGGRSIGRLRLSHGPAPGDFEIMALLQNGNVGVGTADPQDRLDVNGNLIVSGSVRPAAATFLAPDGFAWFHIDNGPAQGRSIGRLRLSHGPNPGDYEIMSLVQTGNVGIGTADPQERLDVNGNVLVSGDIRLAGADCAEEFATTSADEIEPGTIMVIDDAGSLKPSAEPYDRKVAGVVSGAGNYRPAIVLDRQAGDVGRVPIALMGKTYAMVDATHNPVVIGDLLTTSPTRGHAMKATDVGRAFGAILGKALQTLDCGRGIIPILVTLQ